MTPTQLAEQSGSDSPSLFDGLTNEERKALHLALAGLTALRCRWRFSQAIKAHRAR